jgi:hypothetical protein
MLSVENVFFSPNDKREEANEAKRKFVNHEGALLNGYSNLLTILILILL